MIGASGSTVDSSRYGFVLVAANLPSYDTCQDGSVGQLAVGLNNISMVGGTSNASVYVGSSFVSYTNDELLFQNPTNRAPTNVNAALENLQVVRFPGNALAANHFSGEFRGYNIYAGHSGASCVDIEYKGNPFRFFGLIASGCATGVNLVSTGAVEFHGASIFDNTIDVSVTGTTHLEEAYVLFDGLQMGHSETRS